MLSTIYATPSEGIGSEDILSALHDAYRDKPFIRICKTGFLPDTRNVRGTNFCDISVRIDDRCNRLILISAIDNLVKGASGQAVQNMNIMMGLDETAGLKGIPFAL
jgi:N-acetyl-gamma-glutamyl-phosphate reductase